MSDLASDVVNVHLGVVTTYRNEDEEPTRDQSSGPSINGNRGGAHPLDNDSHGVKATSDPLPSLYEKQLIKCACPRHRGSVLAGGTP